MSKESEQSPDELISAFVDGELTGNELARAQELLTSSAQHRQLLADWKALRATLQELPSHRASSSFAQQVQQQCQAALDNASTDSQVERKSSAVPDAAPDAGGASVWARRLFWPLMAAAAGILLMVFGEPARKGELANAPDSNAASMRTEVAEAEGMDRELRRSGAATQATIQSGEFAADTLTRSAQPANRQPGLLEEAPADAAFADGFANDFAVQPRPSALADSPEIQALNETSLQQAVLSIRVRKDALNTGRLNRILADNSITPAPTDADEEVATDVPPDVNQLMLNRFGRTTSLQSRQLGINGADVETVFFNTTQRNYRQLVSEIMKNDADFRVTNQFQLAGETKNLTELYRLAEGDFQAAGKVAAATAKSDDLAKPPVNSQIPQENQAFELNQDEATEADLPLGSEESAEPDQPVQVYFFLQPVEAVKQ
ncbi:MAG: hypothetical protein KDA87_02980 [Planctomycetales bacterium]|nr:hypothetical protein [Planctomycetales bacterium]